VGRVELLKAREPKQQAAPAARFVVRRFMSRAKYKILRKQGLQFDAKKGNGIPTTTVNFEPKNEDEAKIRTGARSAEMMVDLDVTSLHRGGTLVTRAGLPEYPVQGGIGKERILGKKKLQ
jgi:hypothetical protein